MQSQVSRPSESDIKFLASLCEPLTPLRHANKGPPGQWRRTQGSLSYNSCSTGGSQGGTWMGGTARWEVVLSALLARLSPCWSLRETSSAAAQSCHQGVTLPSPPRSEGTLTPALKTASSPGRPRTGCSEASLISCQGASQSGEGGVGESRGQESAAHFREEEAEVRTGLGSPSRTFSTCITIPGRRGHLLSTPIPIGM